MIAAATPPAAPPRGSTPSAPATTAAPRFAVEIGPFLTTGEAQRTEKQANDAGFPTVRLRQKTAGAAVYAVMIERVPRGREAQVLIAKLKADGIGDAVVVGTSDPVAIRVGDPRPLRAAVEMAERLRADGHTVRLAATPGEATTFVIRHGNFASREEAEARGAELMRLGLANQIVQVQ